MSASFALARVPTQSRVLPHVGLSAVGASPTCTFWSCDQVTVACDAELAHTPELAKDGAAAIIAKLYLVHGCSFVNRLHGAFSFALWDHASKTLMLAVDRFGIKRLSYAQLGGTIMFATQPRGIFAGGRFSREVDLSAITEYFVYNVIPIPKTAFSGISRIAPGEFALWSERGMTTTRYWEMQYSESDCRGTRALAGDLLSHMSIAVQKASSDLDLSTSGCFLSGGTDSSSIVGLLTKMYTPPIHAFSIGFTEDRFNELQYARLAARHFHARHIEGRLGPDEARTVVEALIAAYDEPFGNSSAIPTYWCAKLAREHGMDVLLAGDGGDELFGGNERYREETIYGLYQTLPEFIRHHVVEPAIREGPFKNGIFAKARNYVCWSNRGNPERYCRWRLLQKFAPGLILGSGMPFHDEPFDLLGTMRQHHQMAPASCELNRLLYVDVKMTLGDDDLPKVTQTAELAGIRVRFPYLDHTLAEFTGRLPASAKVRFLEKRYLFKKATRELLPREILKKKKHGFGVPIGFWLKSNPGWHAWAKEILYDPRTYQRGYFRREFVEQTFSRMQQDETPYFGDLLWVFLVLELWHRQHVEVTTCCV